MSFKIRNTAPVIVYTIDEVSSYTINVPETPLVISGLDAAKEHFIKIGVEHISEDNPLWVEEAGFIFAGAEVDAGGFIFGIKPRNRRIMYIGDSITAGIGCGGTINYAAVSAKRLGCANIRAAFGFTGIQNPGPLGIPNAFGYIDFMTQSRPETGEFPDVIVVNYGTNDELHNQPEGEFTGLYEEFLKKLTFKYGGVPIFAVIPFWQYKAEDIRKAVSDSGLCNVFLVETSEWARPSQLHPTASESTFLGELLAEKILSVMGKAFFI